MNASTMYAGLRTSPTQLRKALAVMALAFAGAADAQLTVAPQTNLQQLAAAITGPGVQIINPTMNCHGLGFGEFDYTGTIQGLNDGVILTSGRITDAIGPNNVENTSFQANTSGDAILNTVTGRSTRDACRFEFDIIPGGDSISFDFTFASEEYNEWVGSQYNDVFGFFISGPGITGDPGIGSDHNIALIPGTTQPVTINNVNNGSNATYYFDNAGGSEIQYDGYTTGLKAVSLVQPCQSYHLKLIIADATDRKFDSGVFIERINSNPITMTSFTQSGAPDMVEGCNPGFVTFTRSTVTALPLTLTYYLQGTATNGVDYTAIGNVNPNVAKNVTIPANQASVDVPVQPIADGLSESDEYLRFILGNPFCPAQALDTLIFNIVDTVLASITPGTITLCRGDSVQYHITGGANYAWSPAAGLSSTNSADPWAKPTTQTLYTINITEGTCSRTMTRLLRVSDPVLSAVITRPLCDGQSNGAVNLTVTGAVAPFSFDWSGPNGFTATSEDLVNVPAGTYVVVFSDAAGCDRTQSFNVGSPAPLGATLTPSILPFGENVACFGASTGSINTTIVGGTGPYATAWSGPNGFTANTQSISSLAAGAYTAIVTDVNGCTFTTGYTLTQPAALTPAIGNITNVSCAGANIGEATANIVGGIPPYSYTWNSTPAQTSAVATGLSPGNYIATVTDGYGCTSTTTATITGPAQPLSTTVSGTVHVSCFGGSNGSSTVNASGGTSPYDFSWNTVPVQNTAAATNLSAGTWTCTITDANGCSTTRTVTITEPSSALTSSLGGQTNVGCFGAATGSANVIAVGGTSPYAYAWNTTPIQTSAAAANLPAGTWTCIVTDARGCTSSQNVIIAQPAAPLNSSISAQTNVPCFGAVTGSATVGVSGGTGPYTYDWNTSPVQTNAAAINLPAGIHICTITDANGCTTTASVTIAQPVAALSSSVSAQSNVGCFGATTGSASLNASGGTTPYAFSWNTTPVQTTASATNLPAGVWTCTITDANGCTLTRNVNITQPAAALGNNVSTQTNVACFGGSTGSATVTGVGGTTPYVYSWNTTPVQNSATATALAAGTWTCTVSDANGCNSTRTISITQPSAALSISGTTQINVGCFGGSTGSATVTAANGTAPYSYSWNTIPGQSGSTANNLVAGTWTCTIIDANGCSIAQNVSITQPTATLSTSISAQTNVGCYGSATGTATVVAANGTSPYSYSWNTVPAQSTATANALTAGTWTCTVTDANGCSTTRLVSITQPTAALSSSVGTQTNVGCFGGATGSATLVAANGTAPYAYSWNTVPVQNSATANNLPAGTWSCTTTDANGCTAVRNVTITQPVSPLSTAISVQTNAGCFGAATGSVTVAASGATAPYTYSWNTTPVQTSALATDLMAGTWTCTITDALGCATTQQATITQPAAALSSSISAQTNVNCFGANSGSATVTVLGGVAPYAYSWNTIPVQTSATAINLTAGTRSCTISDANGCTTSLSVTITQPLAAISSSISAQTNVGCFGATTGSATVIAAGGTTPYSFSWNTTPVQSTASATNLSAGTWTCTITDANGCTAQRNATITQPTSALTSVLSAQDNVGCFGATTGSATVTVLGGVAPYAFSWNTSPIQSGATANNLAAGTWTCTITDANGCSTDRSVAITQPAAALSSSLSSQTNLTCFATSTGSATALASNGTVPYTYSWNTVPVQNGATASNLSAGTWTCTITDANGCSNARTVTITQPAAALAVTGTVTPATCGGAANGAVDATISGGTAPYTTSWSGPNGYASAAVDITSLESGVYTITVSDANGCSTAQSFNVGQPGLFAISGTTSNFNGFGVSCPSATDGSIMQTVSGGTTPYTHAWSGPGGFTSSTQDINALATGTYTYVISDANGCSTSASYTLSAPAPISVSLVAPVVNGGWNVSCNGSNSGSIDATPSGGVAPISIAWTGPSGFTSANEDVSSAIAGTYSMLITDANGCAATNAITLTQPAALVGTGSQVAAVDCFGNNSGVAQMATANGTAPYAYSWNTAPVQFGAIANDLSAGLWTCTIVDANACSTTATATISGPVAPLAASVTASSNVLCFGASEGSASATSNGGTAPYAYSWDSAPAQLTANATDLLAGSYTVTTTDANGCTATDVVTISEPSAPVDAFFDQVVPVTCFGANDGSATITLSGGSNSFTISWDTQPVTNGPTATGLAPGLYTVTATDNNGCSLVKHYPVTIGGSASALLASTTVTDISCFGAHDGTIDLSISGGQGPYTHLWTDLNGQISADEDLMNMGAEPFSLHLVDGLGCTLDTIVTITEPSAILIAGSITTAACQGSSTGAVDAEVSGGTGPYAYAWSGPDGFAANTPDVTGLSAGLFALTTTDANGCAQNTTFNVSQPGSLQVSLTPTSFNGGWGVSCAGANDGAIDLDANGGTLPYTFQWDGPSGFSAASEDINTLESGTYTATVSDANGCSVTISTTLGAPAILNGILFNSVFGGTNISCASASDGSIDAFIIGGTAPYATTWSGPNGFTDNTEDITGLEAGAYDVIIVDANGCTTTASATLTEPQPLTSTALTSTTVSGDAISCNGASTGSIQLTIVGGALPYTIQWTGPNGYAATNETITDLAAGSYTANILDANGCTTTTAVVLTEPTPLVAVGTISDFNGSGVSCNGGSDGSINLTVSGGAGGSLFSWTGPNGYGSTDEDPTGLSAGTYSVLITDVNGCSTTADFTLTGPAALEPILAATDFNGSNTSCSGIADGSIDLALSGGTAPFNITWNGPNGFVANGEDIAALEAGSYTVEAMDANGCSATANITLTAAPMLTLGIQAETLPGGNQISCSGATDGAIDLTISGGTSPHTIAWTDGVGFSSSSEDIIGLGAGFYQATVTDANGCSQTTSALLNAPSPLDISAVLSSINGNNVTCDGATDGSIDLSVNGSVGPYTFLWTTGSFDEDLTGITAGTYDVTVADLNGCSVNLSYTLTAPATVLVDLTSTLQPGGNNILCAGGSDGNIDAAISGGTTPYDISWIGPNGFSAGSASISALSAGTYDLVVTDANGCSQASTTTLTEPALVAVTLSSVTYNGGFNIPCAEVTVGVFDAAVTGGTPSYTYAWSGPDGFTSTDASLTSLTAGNYDLTVTDSNGCTGGASATLTQPGPFDVVIELTDFGGSPVSCAGNDGGISLSISGGSPAYNFDWTGPNGYGSQQEDLSGLGAGDYALVVRDANGCSTDTTITLTAPEPLQASFAGTANLCADQAAGSIDLTMTGGGAPYTFAWTGPNGYSSSNEDLTNLANGNYAVTVSDGLGCGNTFSTNLIGPAQITSGTYVSFYGLYNLQCQGDSTGVIELTPQGGSTPFSLLINGPGGYSSTALQNQALVAGDYMITITDQNGCQLDTTVTLTEPNTSVDANLTLSVYPSGTNVSCYGASDGSIDATVSGGTGPYVFNWRGPDSLEFATEDVTGLPAGDYNYELVVTDANQCNFFTTVTLTQPDTALYASPILTTYTGGSNTTCETASDGAIDLTANGGNGSYLYLWSGPSGFLSTAQDISGVIGGTYTVDITDLNGCTLQHTVDVIAPEPIAPVLVAFSFPGGSAISCAGLADGSITSTITGGAAPTIYAWSGPNGFTANSADISGLAAGTYCLTVTDANGCTAQQCLELIAPAPLAASTTTVAADCGSTNGSADLTVSGGSAPFSYGWDNGTNNEDLNNVAPGTYYVTVTDANGCSAAANAVVNGSSGVIVATDLDAVVCYGASDGAIDLTVSNGTLPFAFAWSNGTTTEDLAGVAAGSYSVTITDGSGCVFTDSYVITQNTAIAIDTLISTYDGGYNVSGSGATDGSITTAVSGGVAPFTFDWSNGANTESISGLAAGTYTLLVTDANGCTAALEVTLTQGTDVEMPTGFSPNSDGSNDTFVIRGIEGYPKNQLTVLNRWGNIVYEQPNYKNEWAGDNSQGDQLPNGTYFIILSLNDSTRTLQGFVDLRR